MDKLRYPNLLGQKESNKLSYSDLANVLGITRQCLFKKMRTGYFTITECKVLCKFFGVPFDILFWEPDA